MRMRDSFSGVVLAAIVLTTGFTPARAASGGDPGKGKQIYAKSCGGCHGPEGKGDGAAAAAINPKPTNLTDKALMSKLDDGAMTKIIVNGGAGTGKSPLMPAFKQLKDEDVKDLVAYIRSIAK